LGEPGRRISRGGQLPASAAQGSELAIRAQDQDKKKEHRDDQRDDGDDQSLHSFSDRSIRAELSSVDLVLMSSNMIS